MSAFINMKSRFCQTCESVCSIAESNFAHTSRRKALVRWFIALVFMLIAQEARACIINVTGVNFGSYDVFSNVALDSAGNIDINCLNGVGYNITFSAGNGTYEQRVMSSGAHSLNYNLFTAANRVLVWGDATNDSVTVSGSGTDETVDHVVYGRIPPNQNVYPGSYSDTITVEITF
jgi:spore coat protein U-like protein